MKINKKKFIVRMLLFISLLVLFIYGGYVLKTPEAQENIKNYYADVLNQFNNEEIKIAEEIYSFDYDQAIAGTIIARHDSILVVNKDGIKEYSNSAVSSWTEEITLNSPIIAANDKWLVIAEENGKKVITYDMHNVAYETEVDGLIQKVTINKNGYVGVIFAKAGYKNAFTLLRPTGEVVYTKFFANTTLISADISEDGKKVAMVEADTSGAVVNSGIVYLNARGEVLCNIAEKDVLLMSIKFFGDETISVGDSKIIKIDKDYQKTIFDDFSEENVEGINIENNKIIKVYRESAELFAEKCKIEVTNVNGKNAGNGEVAGKVKAVESLGKTIAIVLNDRIDFFDINGRYINSYYIQGDYKDIELFSNGNLVCFQTIDEVSVLKVR